MALLNLTVSKVDSALFEGEVISVSVPGVAGDMTILANHEALISPLKKGEITIKKSDGSDETHQIDKGLIEISSNNATILL